MIERFSGFADEAADDIEGQIAATAALGWRWIEARKVGDRNLTDIDDAAFGHVCERLATSGIAVHCFGSAIANWGKDVADPAETSLAELARALPRMRRLGTRFLRIMSYQVRKDAAGRPLDDQLVEARIVRLREIVARCQDAGVQAVHENCMNYGGMAASRTLCLLERIPGLKLVFDTGNPTWSEDFDVPAGGNGKRPMQSAWAFYREVREHVVHVHIKDAVIDPVDGAKELTFAGDGQGDVRAIVKDLLRRGYEGILSIEPHLALVHHEPGKASPAEHRRMLYLEYGRRFQRLVEDLQRDVARERGTAG